MRMLIHHALEHTHRFIDGPAPAPEILILTVWHGEPPKAKRTAGWPIRASATKGVFHHDYYRRQREMIGDSYPEYDFVLSRESRRSDGNPPHVAGLMAGSRMPLEYYSNYNRTKRKRKRKV